MLPLHLQPQSHVPLYVQLRDQLRALVHAGDLRPGDRIPASRELATMLGVHRTTVANAYAELESEGLIQGHVGRGTFIKGNGNGLKITPPADIRQRRDIAIETYNDHRMAMSLALTGLVLPGITILNPGCTAKTYPRFFEDLKALVREDRKSVV